MNTICSQCGSVLAHGLESCHFCESTEVAFVPKGRVSERSEAAVASRTHEEWRGELDERLEAYRAKRRKTLPNQAQTALPFDDRGPAPPPPPHDVARAVEDLPPVSPPADDFAFTIAIGRIANASEASDPRLLIDVSEPPETETREKEAFPEDLPLKEQGMFAAASLHDRKQALLVDLACLGFAYGAFLALFGSLGGHFTFSKLSATVCFFTFAFVYIQYFGLFTVFGGSTPGMMVSGIQVASFTGDSPTPRQYLLRAVGYLLSAGTCFLGFLWVLWDEDGLTWHDRLSNTYLARIDPFEQGQSSHTGATE